MHSYSYSGKAHSQFVETENMQKKYILKESYTSSSCYCVNFKRKVYNVIKCELQ